MSVTTLQQPTAQGAEETAAEGKAKPPLKKVLMILAAVLALGAAAWFLVLKPAPSGPPKPGEVMKLDPIQVNLDGTHYLRVGIALQLTASAHKVDGSKALDATISELSGLPMTQVNDSKQREKLKEKLVGQLEELYHGEVMGLYFTEFVTQ